MANVQLISDEDTRAILTASKSEEIPATKQFVLNATGNLFVATTLNGGDTAQTAISKEAEEAFGQVSVFFAALTKAMAIPNTKGLRLFDFDLIDSMVSSSGLFVKVTESQIQFKSKQVGIELGNDLLKAVLGLSGNLASIGKTIMDMVMGMGKASLQLSANDTDDTKKVATIIFVCEYLLGAVSITPIVISAKASEVKESWVAGSCLKAQRKETVLNIDKSVYLFVAPKFVEEATKLNEAMANPEFNKLVDSLQSSVGISKEDTQSTKNSAQEVKTQK